MPFTLNPRTWFLLIAASCAALLGYALYVQHALFLDPCPLCIFQRVAFMWIGVVALVLAVHNPGPVGRWLYLALLWLGGTVGAGIAGRHIWLQNLPPDQVPECGMGLNYMLDTMPFAEVLGQVFRGSGECAAIDWTFVGLSMPWWTLIWYIVLSAIALLVVVKWRKQ